MNHGLIDHDEKRIGGGLPQRTSSTILLENLKDAFDTVQTEDGFSTPNQSRDI